MERWAQFSDLHWRLSVTIGELNSFPSYFKHKYLISYRICCHCLNIFAMTSCWKFGSLILDLYVVYLFIHSFSFCQSNGSPACYEKRYCTPLCSYLPVGNRSNIVGFKFTWCLTLAMKFAITEIRYLSLHNDTTMRRMTVICKKAAFSVTNLSEYLKRRNCLYYPLLVSW